VADEVERPGESPERREAEPHLPSATIWPFAFAGGVALLLVGLVVNWVIAAAGAGIALVFGFLWIREVTTEVRREPPPPEPAPAVSELAVAEEEAEPERYPRSKFLEGATLGIGALIGGVVTLPALGFMVAPAFVGQEYDDVDLGPLENFPEGQFVTATFISDQQEGAVSRRTSFVRNNGMANGTPSFTIISNRCVHLGCPVQPQGIVEEETTEVETEVGMVELANTAPSGFGCPCHGGAYDMEGNRTAGPPVRALDRYKFSIRESRLILGEPYSVGEVEGEGADAQIKAYDLVDPGQHVDGPEQFFYPYVP
jgi:Rieske Fe-S protein